MNKPTIILQTDKYRVTHSPSKNPNSDVGTVIIEERRQDTQGAPYWGKLAELWKHGIGMTDFHHLINHLFDNLADQKDSKVPVEDRMPWIETARLNKMGAALRGLLECVRAEGVTIEQSMPFHDPRLSIGIQLSPALEDELRQLFPGATYPLAPFQLACKLFEKLSEAILQNV